MNKNGFIIIIVVVVVILGVVAGCMRGRHRRRRVENDGKEKYILYYSNGGLVHNLSYIIKQIGLAKKYNRTLLIYSKFENEFKIDFNDLFYIDDPELKYKTDKDFGSVNGELLINNKIPFKHYKDIEANWNIIQGEMAFRYKDKKFLGTGRRKVRADRDILIYKHTGNYTNPGRHAIRIQPTILRQIRSKTINTPYIGVHYRNTDYKNNINKSFKRIRKQLKKHKHIKTLFLATDDRSSVDKFRNEFNDKIDRFICYNTINNNGGPIHMMKLSDNKKLQQHVDALTDMYLLYKSDVFIPSKKTGWTKLIVASRKNKKTLFDSP